MWLMTGWLQREPTPAARAQEAGAVGWSYGCAACKGTSVTQVQCCSVPALCLWLVCAPGAQPCAARRGWVGTILLSAGKSMAGFVCHDATGAGTKKRFLKFSNEKGSILVFDFCISMLLNVRKKAGGSECL